MSVAADALFELEEVTVQYKKLERKIDDEGVQITSTEPDVPVEARVIPTKLRELQALDLSTTVSEAFSFYFFDSFVAEANDILNYKGIDYKIFKYWDRNDNGEYTKIIAGLNKEKANINA